VPYYDPAVAYGGWPYPEYPPYYFPPYGYYPGGLIATGIAFGAGYALGRWGANYWGGGINWSGGGNNIEINRGNRVTHWEHNPQHRQGVRYNNASVQQKFGNNNIRAGSEGRMDFRGRSGEQVLKPGGDRAGLGDRGSASRPSVGDRGQGTRPGAGKGPSSGASRPSGGDRGREKQASSAKKTPSSGASRPGDRGGAKQASSGKRPSASGPRRDNAFGNIQSGKMANLQSQRGRASLGGGNGRVAARAGGGRMGGGGFGGGRGGGRRSDVRLKHDITLLGRLDNGLGFYRFMYNGSDKAYVGVMAQEVQTIMPEAVVHDRDGYLKVHYDMLGLRFQSHDRWIASGARLSATIRIHH
jgi:Protein of unknown function (DUF3300)/Chaperone of endosialidase